MTTLIILSIILFLFVAFGIVYLSDIEALSAKQKVFASIVYIIYLIFALSFGITMEGLGERETEKALLDRPNSYKKEYTYKQIDSEFVVVDSTYIKK